MFDVFEECIYSNFKDVEIKDLRILSRREVERNIDYMSLVLSETMSNMLRCAKMLCGSFEND